MVKYGSLPVFVTAAAALLVALASSPATANIVRDDSVTALGQGFGAVPRLLTAQIGNPNQVPEWACNANNGGVISTGAGACSAADATFQGNGLINSTVGFDGNVNPPDSAKNNLVNLHDPALNITDATQILLNYNPSQTGSNPETNIQDITLKFYNASNQLVISVDGGCGNSCTNTVSDPLFFPDTGTNLGNGGVGFVLALDAIQAAQVNSACGANLGGCITVAGETTINLNNDGPDSYTLFSRSIVVPEPASLALLGTALAGFGVLLRRRRSA